MSASLSVQCQNHITYVVQHPDLDKCNGPFSGMDPTLYFRKFLGLLRCISYATLCLEVGQLLIETRVWLRSVKF